MSVKDSELANAEEVIGELQKEKESLKRQLQDIQNTVEFQEAKMDSKRVGDGTKDSGRHQLERKSGRKSKLRFHWTKKCNRDEKSK